MGQAASSFLLSFPFPRTKSAILKGALTCVAILVYVGGVNGFSGLRTGISEVPLKPMMPVCQSPLAQLYKHRDNIDGLVLDNECLRRPEEDDHFVVLTETSNLPEVLKNIALATGTNSPEPPVMVLNIDKKVKNRDSSDREDYNKDSISVIFEPAYTNHVAEAIEQIKALTAGNATYVDSLPEVLAAVGLYFVGKNEFKADPACLQKNGTSVVLVHKKNKKQFTTPIKDITDKLCQKLSKEGDEELEVLAATQDKATKLFGNALKRDATNIVDDAIKVIDDAINNDAIKVLERMNPAEVAVEFHGQQLQERH